MNQSGVLVAVQICILKGKSTLKERIQTDQPVVVNINVRSQHQGHPDETETKSRIVSGRNSGFGWIFALIFHPVGRTVYPLSD